MFCKIFRSVNNDDCRNKKGKGDIYFSKTNRHSNCCSHPDNARCGKSIHGETFFKDYAGTQKTNSAHDIGSDSGRIAITGEFLRNI